MTPTVRIPLLYAVAMAAEGIAALALGRLLDQVGRLVAPAGIAAAALATPLFFLGGAIPAVVGAALWGVGTATQDTVFHALLARHVPQDRHATAYRLFDALRSTAWLFGSIVLGLLYAVSLWALVGLSLSLQFAGILVLSGMGRSRRSNS